MTSYQYNKVYTSVDGTRYRLWVEKKSDTYGKPCKKYGWNKYQYNNWYNDTGSGYFTAKERNKDFGLMLKGHTIN